jgi:hypothetical protein
MRSNEDYRQAMEKEAKSVELLYSTKPKRVFLGEREYRIPANYFSPKQRDEPDTLRAGESGFGFFLFLPDFGGYTKDNWQDHFDRRLIYVVQVKEADKNRMIRQRDGTYRPIHPSAYGDAMAAFENRRPRLEELPSFKLHGLEGYQYKGRRTHQIIWTGTRSSGEFFFLECSLAPGETEKPGAVFPLCQTRYYSEKEDLRIAYRYPREHLAKWREIDDAIWARLHSWQVTGVKGR